MHTTPVTTEPTRCARCSLDVRAWKVHGDDGRIYCTAYCANAAGALEHHDDERDHEHMEAH